MHVESAALSTVHLLPIKICRTALTPETHTSIKLYTGPNEGVLDNYLGLLGPTCHSRTVHCWARDDRRLGSGLKRPVRETGALCNLTPPPQLPLSFHFPGAAAQPCNVMSTVSQHSRVKCVVHIIVDVICVNMPVLTSEDKALIKFLRVEKGWTVDRMM